MSSETAARRKAVFIIPPKVHLLDITGPAHIFYEAACYGAPVDLVFSTMIADDTVAVSSSLLAFHELAVYHQQALKAGDLVFVPGLDSSLLLNDQFIAESRPFQFWLNTRQREGVIICSVCTGAFVLAESGLLDNRACTTHWKYADLFKKRFPLVHLQSNRLFVQENNIYTSAGVASGIDLALYLTEQLWGAHFAARIAKEVVIYFRRTIDDPQLSIFTQYRNHLDDRIHKAQDLLVQSLDKKLCIDELATELHMSARNLTRSFKKHTAVTIGEYLTKVRCERARQLIADGHTLQAAALHCGLKSVGRLRELLAG